MSPFRFLPWFLLLVSAVGLAGEGDVLVVGIEGPIGPATSAFVTASIREAQTRKVAALVLRINTPGGLDRAMREIIQAITTSAVPIIGYVAPSGARAASAGTYILYACPIAAMAPGTNLGAATPIPIGGLPIPAGEGEEKPAPTSAETRKLVEDAAAYLRSLAQFRGRNGEWAERAVREGASLSAQEALDLGVIDRIAPDLPSLLRAIDGRPVRLPQGERILQTAGASILERQPDWKTRLLGTLSNPNLAYILLLLGIYGLVYEFSNPGAVLPGALGALSLVLGLYAFQLLPIQYAGLALLLLGLGLLIAEALVPSFGALGVAGILTFIAGSLTLLDTDAPGFGISLSLILGFAVTSAAVLITLVGLALRARRKPVVSGGEALVGASGIALDAFPGTGRVRVQGEIWRAQSQATIGVNRPVRITGRSGLILHIVPIQREEYGD